MRRKLAQEQAELEANGRRVVVDGIGWRVESSQKLTLHSLAGPYSPGFTCSALRQQACSRSDAIGILRKRALIDRLRLVARLAGRLVMLQKAAAVRAYTPGGRGHADAAASFEAKLQSAST